MRYICEHYNYQSDFMKLILSATFLFISILAYGQTVKQVDSLTFCQYKYAVPEECKAESEYQVKCTNYSIVWLYMTEQMLQFMPDQFVNQLENQSKMFKKETIFCYLLDQEVKGYKISFKKDKVTRYQLIAYGTVNNQPVLVQLSLDNEPKVNEDIPAFPRQIIRLSK